jgi:hypothetical protein
MLSRGSWGSAPRPNRARKSDHVCGMICMSPIARFAIAPAPHQRTRRITDRIQCSGTAKRLDAPVIKAANGSMLGPLARWVTDNARSTCAASLNRIDDATIAGMQTLAPRDRKAAIVFAAVNGENAHASPRRGASEKLAPGLGERSRSYLRSAQAYMLISIPTCTSMIFGVFQVIRVLLS